MAKLLPGILTKRGLISGGGRMFFFLYKVLKGHRVHPGSYAIGTGTFSFGSKAALHKPGPSTPPGAEVKMNGAIPLPSHMP